ncbi:MAG: YraN family protein [Candidatus Omnitrophica bacterium]|nr:YraN family protein [Candidatus Omnitrophota bacterium]
MNTRKRGNDGEALAVEFLKKHGYKIVCRNFTSRRGEIDIVAKDGQYLVFIEVKTRTSPDFGYPSEAVTRQKAERIRKTALYYLMTNRMDNIPFRFEVVSLLKTGSRYAVDVLPLEF